VREEDHFDPEKLRITREQQAQMGATKEKVKHKPKHRRSDTFVQVPQLWCEQLAAIRAHGSTYRVALHLLYEAWATKIRTVKLTNVALTKVGVGRAGKAIALRELRKAGLIAVEQRPRRNPVVTVRFSK
jgi:hypothetical protein